MTLPPLSPEAIDDETALVRPLSLIGFAFCGALILVGLLGAFVLVPHPVVRVAGLLRGFSFGIVAMILPTLVILSRLSAAAKKGLAPGAQYDAVRTTVFVGLALAEAPALFALVDAVTDKSHDVGALVLAIPFAIVSLIVTVAGPGAVRRHLTRVRAGTRPGLVA